MDTLLTFVNFLLHLDQSLSSIVQTYGSWTYLLLFLIIFMETGLVATPFLPGDSLLFAAGTFAALGAMRVEVLYLLLAAAAILGDTVNYWIGRFIGLRAFSGQVRFLKREYLQRTHEFYERHGGKTILLARFVPIIRTFAPFVAGVGEMTYWKFISYNVFGGLLWVGLFIFGGYFFGNLGFVRENFTLVVVAIIFISILPGVVEFLRKQLQGKMQTRA
ncbi:MAG: DedA family protein [Anaerolineales bacterium]|nr:DedA family protein [Anaerolineales bacterium]MCS7248737.1 DedA family protein [Anaerolineales bacterium]MDW8162550.1 DedA family protein [Anaerolineales bacterium]MDW8445755.1 DedA family protein [Anaerolineales bacterium]